MSDNSELEILSLKNISHIYDQEKNKIKILNNINISIKKGQMDPLKIALASSFRFLIFLPNKNTEPIEGFSSKPAIFNKVDFPDPLGPISETICPFLILILILLSIFILFFS
jgi:hypothetical protein